MYISRRKVVCRSEGNGKRERGRAEGKEGENKREREKEGERARAKEMVGRESDLGEVRERRSTGVEEDGNTSTESTLQALPLVRVLPLAGVSS